MSSVVHSLDEVVPASSVVTIGVFDGVHRGHAAIVGRAVSAAEQAGVRSVAATFDPHPTRVVRPDATPPLLQPLDLRVRALRDLGVDLVLVLPFTRELSAMSPPEFVEHVLVEPLRTVRVVVGTNFRFGHRAAGDVETLADLGPGNGYVCEAVDLLHHEGTPISSTEVRRHVADGDVAWVAAAIGRPWEYVGEVVRGDGRGRTIDVPTANVAGDAALLRPGVGVYAARVTLPDGGRHDAVVNVGTRPTFDGTTTTVEAHLLDTGSGPEAGGPDLYGTTLRVAFLDRIRDERRFDGPDDLVAQIREDVAAGRRMLTGA